MSLKDKHVHECRLSVVQVARYRDVSHEFGERCHIQQESAVILLDGKYFCLK